MAHKINPNSYRLGINVPWSSRWFLGKNAPRLLEEDVAIRKVVNKKLKGAGIDKVDIERSASNCKVLIKVAKPGLVIGRGGKGIEELTEEINSALNKISKKYKGKNFSRPSLNINVEEIRRGDISARVVAQQVADDLERRLPSRRTMKKHLDVMIQNKEVQGAKIKLSGRLNGAEIARKEWLSKGRLPLTTLRANIDYGEATAFAAYGTLGIKIWIYKGER